MNLSSQARTSGSAYATLWRWHFYAGLFVLPFVMVLALSGSIYLFKIEVEAWEEAAFRQEPPAVIATPHERLEAALDRHPGATFLDYRLPRAPGDAAMVRLVPAAGGDVRQVFVGPDAEILGELAEADRIMAMVKCMHSQLLVGGIGNRIVELVASWTIVMVLTGLYLWWPRGRGVAGVIWPRLRRGKRLFWRDLHAVTGFWISALVLLLLATGLPWTGVWGAAFNAIRAEMGWVNGPARWNIDSSETVAASSEHDHRDMATSEHAMLAVDAAAFDRAVANARMEGLSFPAIVTPPGAPGRFGAPGVNAWTIRSDNQNPPFRTTVRYDLSGRREIEREAFADTHVIDRAVGYGIAWHEGRLFGRPNQVIGVVTAMGLVVMTVSGFLLWRRRKPANTLGAPPAATSAASKRKAALALLALALFLPLLAASLVALFVIEKLVLPQFPRIARWLGFSR